MAEPVVRRLTLRSVPLVLLSLPGVVLGLLSALMMAAALLGSHPLWEEHPLNMAEAAALRDPATVLLLLERGENPAERRPIRAGVLFDRPMLLTPLEAAIAARRPEVVELLLTAPKAAAPVDWLYAHCLAVSVDDSDIQRVVHTHADAKFATRGTVDCSTRSRPW